MFEVFLAIAPIFLLIVLGHGLRRGGIPSFEFWNMNDKLVYWVLFPPLLFYKMATMDLSGDMFSSFAIVIYAGFIASVVFSMLSGRVLRLDKPLWTSVLQGCSRHNTFIALAVAEELFGTEGLALATLITALLIPVTNVSVVSLIIMLLRGLGSGGVLRMVLKDLTRNPILISVFFGLLFNLGGVVHVPILYDLCVLLGGAALPIVLLCVGANIRIRAMTASAIPTIVSVAGKMLVFPLVIAVVANLIGMDAQATLVAVIFGAVPTAASAYTLARQMGGDAPAMAAIVTIQTALSFITLPITLLIVSRWLGVAL